MAITQIFFFFFFFFSTFFFYLPCKGATLQTCSNPSCSSIRPTIRFPFSLISRPEYHCGYPRFGLSCNNRNQTIINLPFAGDFVVKRIDYAAQRMWINDPEDCLPKKFLEDFKIVSDTFKASPYLHKYTFFNCSLYANVPTFLSISCLGGKNYSVMAVRSLHVDLLALPECREITQVLIPARWDASSARIGSDIQLRWSEPSCGSCEQRGGVCGFKSGTSSAVLGCSIDPPGHVKRTRRTESTQAQQVKVVMREFMGAVAYAQFEDGSFERNSDGARKGGPGAKTTGKL
ncbi:hypothetical protein L1049_022792 [Liquidambar formosana]|uniref:RING-type E3 ubiquitin transferase n=1 Tax=Liquidambar formosana TaxID=63359 RepID=A0AAP0REH0_LIQFO